MRTISHLLRFTSLRFASLGIMQLREARGVANEQARELEKARGEVTRLRAMESQSEVKESQSKGTIRELGDKCRMLKGLVGQLERTRDGLLQKLESKGGEVRSGEDRLEREGGRIKLLSANCQKLETEKEALRKNLEDLDASNDALESRLDEIVDKLNQAKTAALVSDRRAASAEEAARDIRERAEGAVRQLAAREGEIVEMGEAVARLQGDQEEYRRVLAARERELERSAMDLASMTREAQGVSVEAGRLGGELAEARGRLDDLMGKYAKAEHKLRGVELEKADIIKSYRAVVDEKGTLEGGVEELGNERMHLGAEINRLQDECSR